jgi:hypothetical protein
MNQRTHLVQPGLRLLVRGRREPVGEDVLAGALVGLDEGERLAIVEPGVVHPLANDLRGLEELARGVLLRGGSVCRRSSRKQADLVEVGVLGAVFEVAGACDVVDHELGAGKQLELRVARVVDQVGVLRMRRSAPTHNEDQQNAPIRLGRGPCERARLPQPQSRSVVGRQSGCRRR